MELKINYQPCMVYQGQNNQKLNITIKPVCTTIQRRKHTTKQFIQMTIIGLMLLNNKKILWKILSQSLTLISIR